METRNFLRPRAYVSRVQEWTRSHGVLEHTGCGRHRRLADATWCCSRLAGPSTWTADCRNRRKYMRLRAAHVTRLWRVEAGCPHTAIVRRVGMFIKWGILL